MTLDTKEQAAIIDDLREEVTSLRAQLAKAKAHRLTQDSKGRWFTPEELADHDAKVRAVALADAAKWCDGRAARVMDLYFRDPADSRNEDGSPIRECDPEAWEEWWAYTAAAAHVRSFAPLPSGFRVVELETLKKVKADLTALREELGHELDCPKLHPPYTPTVCNCWARPLDAALSALTKEQP